MLPYGFYLRALYYNKRLFAAAGVGAPPRTLDEFVAVSKKVSSLPENMAIACAAAPAESTRG